MKKVEINQEHFIELYNQGLSDTQISKIFKCSNKTVSNFRNKLGLEIQRIKIANKRKSKIQSLYDRGYNDIEIGKRLNLSACYILSFRKELQLERQPLNNIQNFTKVEEEVFIGSLLGDASIKRPKKEGHNCGAVMAHGIQQLDYLKWKESYLRRFSTGIKIADRLPDKRTGNIYTSCYFYMKAHPVFLKFRNLFYPEGIKIIPKEIKSILSPLSLAIWYMDDGYKNKSGNYIATNSYSEKDLSTIQTILYTKFNIKSNIHHGNRLYIPKSQDFEKLISAHIIDSMKYKIVS